MNKPQLHIRPLITLLIMTSAVFAAGQAGATPLTDGSLLGPGCEETADTEYCINQEGNCNNYGDYSVAIWIDNDCSSENSVDICYEGADDGYGASTGAGFGNGGFSGGGGCGDDDDGCNSGIHPACGKRPLALV